MAELDGPERRRRRGFRLTAKYQVSGWRFLYRRLQHALVRRDTRMIDDPQRAQAGPLPGGRREVRRGLGQRLEEGGLGLGRE